MKLIFTFSLAACFSFGNLFSQGFGNTPTNWSIPQGGHTYSTIDYGYDALGDSSTPGDIIGNQTWSVLDINGDGKPDLVVTAEAKAVSGFANAPTVFGNVGSTYWKVYLNSGGGFSNTATNWPIPQGGHTYTSGSTTINYGFDALGYTAQPGSAIGDQSWSIIDINGDAKPDLVVTAEAKAVPGLANAATAYGEIGSAYWKVYLNNGSGFNNTATNWTIPQGGHTYTSGSTTINYGFDALGDYAAPGSAIGDQSWSILDVNGDAKPDLVVTAQSKAIIGLANAPTVFGSIGSAYWKVFLNNGSSFSSTATNWPIPQGGHTYTGNSTTISYGFDALGYSAAPGSAIGDQSWSVIDVNGDTKPDLVVTAQAKAVTGLANAVTVFGNVGSAYWNVFFNNGSGFSSTATSWSIPQGGRTYTGNGTTINFGYDALGYSSTWGAAIGDRSWSVSDMNGDGKPDLVVTAASKALAPGFNNAVTAFGLPSNPKWIVYLNNGSGFNTSGGNWTIPQGGHSYTSSDNSASVNFGYDALGYSAAPGSDIGNQTWSVIDLNNDSKPDLVLTAETSAFSGFANIATAFGPTNGHFWKVFLNTGVLQTNNFAPGEDAIAVFPNPSNGQFQIEIPTGSQDVNLNVSDLAGRAILSQTGSKAIDLSAFPKGIYILNIHMGQESYTKKLILK